MHNFLSCINNRLYGITYTNTVKYHQSAPTDVTASPPEFIREIFGLPLDFIVLALRTEGALTLWYMYI